MHLEMACVEAFHDKQGVSETTEWQPYAARMGKTCIQMSKELEPAVKDGDVHALRAHLLLEELGEFLCAQTEVEALDGLTDLLYVLLGTAVTYNWPLSAAFAEVHRSNMSKVRQEDDDLGNRVRDKGPAFQPPQLAEVLKLHGLGLEKTQRVTSRQAIKDLHAAFERADIAPETPPKKP